MSKKILLKKDRDTGTPQVTEKTKIQPKILTKVQPKENVVATNSLPKKAEENVQVVKCMKTSLRVLTNFQIDCKLDSYLDGENW
jgi:hypothetical protein